MKVVRGRGDGRGMERRANIEFCFKLAENRSRDCGIDETSVRGSRVQIFRWLARLKSVVETIEDEARLGRPFSVRDERFIAKVRKRIQ